MINFEKKIRPRVLAMLLCVLASNAFSLTQGKPPAEALDMMKDFYLPVLVREDVATELGMSAQQKEKVKAAFEGEFKGGGGRPPSFIPSSMIRGMIRKKLGGVENACLSQLNASQKSRLKELWFQWLGSVAVYRKDVKKLLATTGDQEKSIRDIQGKMFEAHKKGSFSPLLIDANEQYQLDVILNQKQRKALDNLRGVRFKFDGKNLTYVKVPRTSSV